MDRPLIQTRVLTNNGVRTVAPLGVWKDWLFSEELHEYAKYGYEFKVFKGYTFGKKVLFQDYFSANPNNNKPQSFYFD